MKKAIIILIVIAAVVGIGGYAYRNYRQSQEMLHPKFYSGNGRLEATEIYVSSKLAGRIEEIFVKEGDLVRKGDKLVRMQTSTLEAQKAGTLAKIKVQEGELAMAQATVKHRESAFTGAEKEFKRQSALLSSNAVSQREYDATETRYNNAKADLEYAKASVLAAEGRVAQQKAELQHIEADLVDSVLIAAYDGRIQYLLAHEGEVLSAGGRVMNLVNLTDTYMTFFLPTSIAGRVQMGAEVKLVFDAAPNHALNARVTYIDPIAQFTPKSVETRLEREKLMFRIKANLNAEKLQQYISDVKTGLPGVAWVKLDPEADWESSPVKGLSPAK
ncbi:MAG: HlyD family efflux transporter periplasmic adaptor subunit [Lentisphaerae bacterium]|jgi:HlyD family secretion protein|nr:HlyD family efflux transporter periplasmic adaptor subunit [Lentisphaerota bacterium]